jgi:hypothetical protein
MYLAFDKSVYFIIFTERYGSHRIPLEFQFSLDNISIKSHEGSYGEKPICLGKSRYLVFTEDFIPYVFQFLEVMVALLILSYSVIFYFLKIRVLYGRNFVYFELI